MSEADEKVLTPEERERAWELIRRLEAKVGQFQEHIERLKESLGLEEAVPGRKRRPEPPRSAAMSDVFEKVYGGTLIRMPTWERPLVDSMLERYKNADYETTVYIERYIQQIIVDENIETGSAYFVSGLRIYEEDEGAPRYVVARINPSGWFGFQDVVKLIGLDPKGG